MGTLALTAYSARANQSTDADERAELAARAESLCTAAADAIATAEPEPEPEPDTDALDTDQP